MLSALDLYRTRGTSSGGGSNSVSAASSAAGDGGGGQSSKTLRASSSSPSAKEWTSNAAPSPTPELKKWFDMTHHNNFLLFPVLLLKVTFLKITKSDLVLSSIFNF